MNIVLLVWVLLAYFVIEATKKGRLQQRLMPPGTMKNYKAFDVIEGFMFRGLLSGKS